MVDFTQYQPPGVYVEDTTRPLVTTSTPLGSITVLVGPGRGYQSLTEAVVAHVTPGTDLTAQGIYDAEVIGPPYIAAPVVTATDGTVLDDGPDYTLDVIGTGPTATTKIVRAPAGLVAENGTFIVSYNYADSAYFTPLIYEEFDGIANVYGEAFSDASSDIVSPLSLAAKVAFENGSGRLMIVPTDPADGTYQEQLVAAYAKVVTDYRAGVIVPLLIHGYVSDDGAGDTTSDANDYTSVSSLITDILTHLSAAEADGYGRIAIIGLDAAYDQTGGGFDQIAVDTASKRAVLVYPPKVNLYNSTANQTIEVSGYYFSAALAGILSSQSVERGLTRSLVKSFVSLPSSIFQAMTKSFKDTLSSSGVTVIETDRLQRLSVRHGVTTDMSALTTREISLVRIADTLFQSVQFGMDNSGLIGEPIDEEMPSRVKGALVGILEQSILDDVILEWDNLAVRQQSLPGGDPTVIECKFSYKPALPLNYITVQFQIDLQTGLLAFTDENLGSGAEGATV